MDLADLVDGDLFGLARLDVVRDSDERRFGFARLLGLQHGLVDREWEVFRRRGGCGSIRRELEEEGRLVVGEELFVEPSVGGRGRVADGVPPEEVERGEDLAELVSPRRKVGVVECEVEVGRGGVGEREFERVDDVDAAPLLRPEEPTDDADVGVVAVERLARVVVRDVEERERMAASERARVEVSPPRRRAAERGASSQADLESFLGRHGRVREGRDAVRGVKRTSSDAREVLSLPSPSTRSPKARFNMRFYADK